MSGCLDEVKLGTTTTYVMETMKLWWRTRMEELETSCSVDSITTWEEMKEALYV